MIKENKNMVTVRFLAAIKEVPGLSVNVYMIFIH